MSFRRTVTFPERELLEELERLQDVFDAQTARIQELEREIERLRNTASVCTYPSCQHEAEVAEERLAIAVDALDKIQNCNVEIITAEDGEFSVLYFDAPEARDLAILMASRALDEINGVPE